MIHHGDAIEAMAAMEPESVDAIVTDPPYGIGFMGREWDQLATAPNEARWNKRERNLDVATAAMRGEEGVENFRHSVSGATFAEPNPRCAKCGKVRNGAPKHVCQCGDEWSPAPRENRQAQRSQQWHHRWAEAAYRVAKPSAYLLAFGGTRTVHRMTVALEDAGWIIRDMLVWAYASGFPKSKASLKPAWEPIVMARKPGPLRMLAIDLCRIGFESEDDLALTRLKNPGKDGATVTSGVYGADRPQQAVTPAGRWPANLILTDPIFDGGVEGVVGGGAVESARIIRRTEQSVDVGIYSPGPRPEGEVAGYGDSGTYSRFFLVPKSSRSDREPAIPPEWFEDGKRSNSHPTCKPTELMRHLVRLVTPSGGTVLDPFGGSGTTAIACELEGFPWILVEKESEYVAIAEARLNGTQRGLGLAG